MLSHSLFYFFIVAQHLVPVRDKDHHSWPARFFTVPHYECKKVWDRESWARNDHSHVEKERSLAPPINIEKESGAKTFFSHDCGLSS